jgi:D-alanine-D-alanine ligase
LFKFCYNTAPGSSKEKMPVKHRKLKWRVAVVSNIKDKNLSSSPGLPPDAFAEFDSIETVRLIQKAIETDGHKTELLLADKNLPRALEKYRPDICYNDSEGIRGDAREAQTPALLEMLSIPYTHSRVLSNAIALDKTLTKRLWRDHGLPTASFQEFATGEESLAPGLEFPLFVKPAREGSGMGIDENSIVSSLASMRERVNYIISTYKQPALVETYLPGREFTVGILGGPRSRDFGRHPEWYNQQGFHRFPVLELDSANAATPGIYSFAAKSELPGVPGAPNYICPTEIDPALESNLQSIGLRAHLAIGALDISRVDIRLDSQRLPQLMEINPLPGLTPGYSDLCIQAEAEGIQYEDLILEILYLAAGRWGLLEPHEYLSEKDRA